VAGRPRTVVWTALARDGLDEALGHIAEDSPAAAERVLDVVLRTAESLSLLSLRGRIVPELGEESVREVFVYSYRILYEVLPGEVQILAFLHGARDFNRWLREKVPPFKS
jgi:toxin ParE1/3/4